MVSKKNRNWAWDGDKPQYAYVPDGPTPPRARKDRRRWCRGKVGVEHVPQIAEGKYLSRKNRCQWRISYSRHFDFTWWCRHERHCVNCGKILDPTVPRAECPEIRPRPEGPLPCARCGHPRSEHGSQFPFWNCHLCDCRHYWWEEALE